MAEIFVSFEGDLGAENRAAFDRLGWKLFEHAGSTRRVVRVPDKDTGDLHALITDALGHEPIDPKLFYDVDGAAERLGLHRETIKRRVASGELPADRRGPGRTAALLLHKRSIDHLAEVQAHERRVREAGIVAGYGDAEFDEAVQQRHGRATMEQVRAIRERGELLAQMAREVRADADLHREFEQLDEDQAIEATARAIAGRVRREERVQRRAAQILADGDDEHPA
jgi:excisionase family DNA binding protein